MSWEFMFMTLEQMGVASGFLDMMKLLFKGAKVVVCLNGGIKKPLDVQRKVNKDTLVIYLSPSR